MLRFWFVIPLLLLTTACSRPTVVHGSVQYENRPVANGYITFFPVDNEGNSAGADISNGKFVLKDVTPGKKRVLITTHPLVLATKFSEGEKPTVKVQHVERIAADAVGNNEIIDIKSGEQTIDIKLYRRKQ